MPKKKNKNNEANETEKWLNAIKTAEHIRIEADQLHGYSRAQLMWEGNYKDTMPSFIRNVPLIPINEVYAFTKAFIPSVFSRSPHISVNPKGKRHIASAKMTEIATNAYWRELRINHQMKRVIKDAIFAEGWMKLGYSAEIGKIDESKPSLESNEFIRNEEIFVTRTSWRNMVRDPNAVDGINDARWLAERIIKPLKAVKNTSLYDNTKDLKANFTHSGHTHLNQGQGTNSQRPLHNRHKHPHFGELHEELVVLWEIWDRDTNRVYTLAEGHDKWLMNKEWPYKIDGFPYKLLRFNDDPDETYAPNMIDAWIPQLWEKIKLRSMQMDHLKRFNRQLSIEEGSMSPGEIAKLKQGRTGSVTKRKKGTLPPAPIQYPQFQSDASAIENRIDLDKDNVSGQPNAVRSAPQRTQSRTLGEIDRLITSFQARQTEPQGILEDFAAEIAYTFIALMKEFMPGERFVKATQKEIQEVVAAFPDKFDGTGFTFTKEDIQDMEFEIQIKTGSTLPLNREGRMAELINLLKLGPTIGVIPGGKVSLTIGKNIVGEFDMKEIEIAYDEMLAKVQVQEKLQKHAQRRNLENTEQQIQEMKEEGAPPPEAGEVG